MKHFILFALLIMGIISCSTKSDVKEMSKSFEPVLEQDAQVDRVISMIKKDKGLDEEKKKDLVKLINEQSVKITE